MRHNKGLSSAIVANFVGISEETLARYERSECLITIDTMRKAAITLNCSVLEFLCLESFHYPHNDPTAATAIFAETVYRLLKLCKTIDKPEDITRMVADLIHDGEANSDATQQFIQKLGEAVGMSILFRRQLAPNTPEAAEALTAIGKEVGRAA